MSLIGRATNIGISGRTVGKFFALNIRQVSLLSGSDRDEALVTLKKGGWAVVSGRDAIQKKYEFKDFVEAWGFMSR